MRAAKGLSRRPHLFVMALAVVLLAGSAWSPVARAVSGQEPAPSLMLGAAVAPPQSDEPSARASVSLAALPLASTDVVLYDQHNYETDYGISSQDFSDAGGEFDAYDNMAADDFSVPDHTQWRVTSVEVLGHYRVLSRQNLLEGVNVSVFANDPFSKKPAPEAVCSYTDLTPTALDTLGTRWRIELPTACVVPEGNHWVSVQAIMPFLDGFGNQWYWRTRSLQSFEKSKWRSPGNGLGWGCLDWDDTVSCDPETIRNYPDFVFRLLGTSEDMPVDVDVSTLAVTPNQDGWYTQNPVDLTFNFSCPVGTTQCSENLEIEIKSAGELTRFYVYGGDHEIPQQPLFYCVRVPNQSSPHSFRGLRLGCMFTLDAGQSVEQHMRLWIQPSAASSLEVSARWAAVGVPGQDFGGDSEKVRVDQARIHPLIFIPGILGTMPPDPAGQMDPNLDIYEPLLTNLEKMGYESGKSLFPFPYDWRRSNDVSADKLATRIPQVLTIANQQEYVGDPSTDKAAEQVDLVVHSMGGLVTRAYVQSDNYQRNVRKAIFIATPHKGFPVTYRTYEGLTWDMYFDDSTYQQLLLGAMNGIIWPSLITKKYSPTIPERLLGLCVPPDVSGLPIWICPPSTYAVWSHHPTRGIESLPQMLPTSDVPDYLTCAGLPLQSCPPPSTNPYGRPANTWLDALNANADRLADRLGLENIYVIFGTGSDTETGYEVAGPLNPFYRNGTPVTINRSSHGDELIPTDSTDLSILLPGIPASNVAKLVGPDARHKEIMYQQQVQQGVVPGFLGAMDLPFSTAHEPGLSLGELPLLVGVLCPLNLTITDRQGRRVGFDPATDGSVVEIPGAVYAAPYVEGQYIILPDSAEGPYRITGKAYGDGDYEIHVSRLEPNGLRRLAAFAGTVKTGDTLNLTVEVEDLADTTPPTIQSVVATPDVLWPANHRMTPVSVAVDASDDTDPSPVCRITSVTSSEPENAPGDGNTTPDWNITGPLALELRAERSGRALERVYTIEVECADASGNRATAPVTVRVPHDQRRR